jgi:membrane protease YdiL (CAAX protease family)
VPAPTPPTIADWIVSAVFVLIGLWVYGRQVRAVLRDGGKVAVAQFDLPELMMSLVFAVFFSIQVLSAVTKQTGKTEPVNIDLIIPSSLIFVVFVVGISAFMAIRGLPLRNTFGLGRLSPLTVVGWAAGLLLAVFPLAHAAQVITELMLHGEAEQQGLVQLFNKVSAEHNYSAMAKIFFSAVIVAPTCEEFLFRGFFYGVWKRYLGGLGAGFLACLLFAAFHASLSAFAGLFILAVCLNIAYERTGSLWVPMGMHALFNLTSLAVVYGQAQMTAAQ